MLTKDNGHFNLADDRNFDPDSSLQVKGKRRDGDSVLASLARTTRPSDCEKCTPETTWPFLDNHKEAHPFPKKNNDMRILMYNRLINFKSGDPESMTKLGQRWQTVVHSWRWVHNVAGTNLGSTA